ncbi:MAG: sulfatase-like hydrolase/transferase [Candidatus Omnitrophica bacterium]|nr:sulfatase-like hydrolase/transferase [Candidatus Omnitrophota bacterium]
MSYFNGINSALIYHLRVGLSGAGFLEYWELIAGSIVFTIFGFGFSYWLFSKKDKNNPQQIGYFYAALSLIILSLFFNPSVRQLHNLLFYKSATADFDKFYKQPQIKQIKDSKNLVVIYAEGLERTYFDETIFPGLMKELRALQSKSTYFTNIAQLPGTEFTMGGIVASQCGIGLFAPGYINSMEGVDEFLPSAIGLGNLLHDQGYYLTFYGGARLDFAGKGKFFTAHKFDEIAGRTKLLNKLEDKTYKTNWGLYDDFVIDCAYQRFIELSETKDKFGLFLLTLDTHFNGRQSKSCQNIAYKDGSNSMLNAVAGSDYLIANFVKKIMSSVYGPKTVVVIVSDHLGMHSDASALLNKGKRRNLFMIIEGGSKKATKIEKLGSTLDIGTTLLPFIGYSGEIGLGRNLINQNQNEEEIKTIHKNLLSWKKDIALFWNFPKIEKYIKINVRNGAMNIDGRVFGIPALIEFNDALETIIRFDDGPKEHQLVNYVRKLNKKSNFILIDHCSNARKLDSTLGQDGACLIAGKGRTPYVKLKLSNKTLLTPEIIRNFVGLKPLPKFQIQRIAHAGGGIDEKTYTNSLEALNENIKNGFKYFELDFYFTSDKHLVCIHDWQQSFEKAFGFKAKKRPSLRAFETLVKKSPHFKNCTVKSLATWMQQNPSAVIITDIKENNLKGLQILSRAIPDFEKRIIPQIYNPKNYSVVKKMGYGSIIWTLYRYREDNAAVLRWVDEFSSPFAITMPKARAETTLPKNLSRKNIPTYVHTINSQEEKNKFINEFGISEIYTDFLRPKITEKQ